MCWVRLLDLADITGARLWLAVHQHGLDTVHQAVLADLFSELLTTPRRAREAGGEPGADSR